MINNKSIAFAIVGLIILAAAYFLTRPVMKSSPQDPSKLSEKTEQKDDKKEEKEALSSADDAFQQYLDWKKENNPSLQEQDSQLETLGQEFPKDYRFLLERIRGSAKIKGVHSHTEEFELLSNAAKMAIECQCNDAAKMLADLKTHAGDKSHGFWKLSTHPKQWDVVIEALEHKDVSLLNANDGHGH